MAGVVAVGASGGLLWARLSHTRGSPTPITVFRSSTCECCAKWVDYLRSNNFVPSVHDEDDLDKVKDKLGVPKEVRSCHTAQIQGYLTEGHVPAADIRRLLAERPKVAGLAVPGMPARTPGMAGSGDKIEGFGVVAFQSNGATQTFAQY